MPCGRNKKEANMKRAAVVLAVAVVIGTAAYGTSHAAPIAPLTGVETRLNNPTKVYWYRQRRHFSWRAYPYWVWGAYPSRHYWDPRPYWDWQRWGWWLG
jgi:hypothetical protein